MGREEQIADDRLPAARITPEQYWQQYQKWVNQSMRRGSAQAPLKTELDYLAYCHCVNQLFDNEEWTTKDIAEWLISRGEVNTISILSYVDVCRELFAEEPERQEQVIKELETRVYGNIEDYSLPE